MRWSGEKLTVENSYIIEVFFLVSKVERVAAHVIAHLRHTEKRREPTAVLLFLILFPKLYHES